MTPAEARALVKSEPGRFRAAFIEGSAPLRDDPEARVRLHPTVKAADDELRARKEALVKSGWTMMRGSLTWGYFVFERDGETLAICVDRAKRQGRG